VSHTLQADQERTEVKHSLTSLSELQDQHDKDQRKIERVFGFVPPLCCDSDSGKTKLSPQLAGGWELERKQGELVKQAMAEQHRMEVASVRSDNSPL
jgi:hypothetical protein